MQDKVEQKSDKILLVIILMLIIFGLIMITSSGVFYAQTRFEDEYFFLKHQLYYGVVPGLIALYIFQKMDYHKLKKIAVPFFFLSLIVLVLVFIPGLGTKAYGASRWIKVGSLSFQPAEALKLSIILYLAAWLESRGRKRIQDVFEGFVPFIIVLGIAAFLLIKQPDVGTLGMIVIIATSVFFFSGAKLSHIFTMIGLGLAGLAIMIKTAPYRLNRFLVFLDPSTDPTGIGYQINQALLAVGSGGVFGVGLGHSRQKFNYLPEPVGDSIFAIIGEELGIIGTGLVVLLFLFLALRALKIAQNAPDDFGRLIAIGITSWIIFQAFINIAAIINLIPLTGIPLPFISYGGTSLLFLMIAVGILLNISKQAKINN